jgi:NitT/TauT family transport system substrate-binding protein
VYHGSPRVFVTFKTTGIKGPADFKGHNIGVKFGGDEYEFLALMDKFGLDWKKDMTVIQQGFTLEPFLNGQMDVAEVMTYNELMQLYEGGVKPDQLTIIDLADYGVGMASQILFVKEDWLAKNKDLAARFMRASIKGWQDALQDRPGALAISLRYMEAGVTNAQHEAKVLDAIAGLVIAKGMTEKDIMAIDEADFKNSAELAFKYGLVKVAPDVPASYTTEIWEMATGLKTPVFKR